METWLTDGRRYRRSAALLYWALITPVAAHFMVPVNTDVYSVLLINDAAPVLTPPVLGLELGMMTATILTPLAYVFLRAGPTRRRPWQITDVAPYPRPFVALGQWAADTAALWVLLGGLTAAGVVLMFHRAGATVGSLAADLPAMIACLWLTAAPALALVAAVRVLLGALRLTRAWVGDVAFFFLWILGLSLPIVFAGVGNGGAISDPSPFADPFGMLFPVVQSVSVPVTELTLGGGPPTEQSIAMDALGGTLVGAFILARGAWLVVAAGLALMAGVLYESHRPAASGLPVPAQAVGASSASRPPSLPVLSRVPVLRVAFDHLRLMASNRWLTLLLVLSAMSGVVLSYRELSGPALLLFAIFALSSSAARWERGDLRAFLDTSGCSAPAHRLAFVLAGVMAGALLHLPSLAALQPGERYLVVHMLAIIFGVPVFCALGAWLTREAVAARLILVIVWYVYFASA